MRLRIHDVFCGELPREISGAFPDWSRWEIVSAATLNGLPAPSHLAALVISGSMLLLTTSGDWHHSLGEIMIGVGVVGMLVTGFGALRRGQGQRR